MYAESFRMKIKKARENIHFTQMEVEKETGIKQSMLSRIENGSREPDLETIGILIDFYGVSADWIFGTGKNK